MSTTSPLLLHERAIAALAATPPAALPCTMELCRLSPLMPHCGAEPLPPCVLALPLLVHAAQDGEGVVVDGARRLGQLRERGAGEALCLRLEPGTCTPVERTALHYLFNRHRMLSMREQIALVRFVCSSVVPPDRPRAAALLGLAGHLQRLLGELERCDDAICAALVDGKLHPQSLELLLALPPGEHLLFLDIFSRFRMSVQTQRELLDWVPEIALREETSCARVLAHAVERTAPDSTPAGGALLHDALRTQRFPLLAAAQHFWHETVSRITPDTQRVRFEPSAGFERARVQVHVTVDSAQRAGELFAGLAALPPRIWEQLLSPGEEHSAQTQ